MGDWLEASIRGRMLCSQMEDRQDGVRGSCEDQGPKGQGTQRPPPLPAPAAPHRSAGRHARPPPVLPADGMLSPSAVRGGGPQLRAPRAATEPVAPVGDRHVTSR